MENTMVYGSFLKIGGICFSKCSLCPPNLSSGLGFLECGNSLCLGVVPSLISKRLISRRYHGTWNVNWISYILIIVQLMTQHQSFHPDQPPG